MKTIVGIVPTAPGCDAVSIEPAFIKELEYAKGHVDTLHGRVSVSWTRQNDEVNVEISIPAGMKAHFRGKQLEAGKTFVLVKV